jgi:salicylate hydroxylase
VPAPVIIAGAGIAGLALALELESRNIPTHLVERENVLAEVGAGLQLPPNSGRILARFPTLLADIDRLSVAPEKLAFTDATSGKTIAAMPLGRKAVERWGAPYRVIHRADLQAALLRAVTEAGVPITMGARLTAAQEHGAGITVTIRINGRDESHDAAALIGADGLRSEVRVLMGDATPPRFTGDVAWRAVVQHEERQDAVTRLWLGPQTHIVTYPISGGQATNMVAVVRGAETLRGARFAADIGGWAPAMREAVSSAGWTPWPLYERDARRAWAKGRIALIGDAAHAMLPHLAQGAAQAVEDAQVLADCLVEHSDPGKAFQRYEQRRKGRVTRIQNEARANGRVYRLPWPASTARNTALRLLGPERLMARVDWLYAAPSRA